MSGAYSIATHKRYGLQRVCRIWQVPRSTVYAHRHRSDGEGAIDSRWPKKRGPMGPCSDPVLVEQIGQVLTDSPFHGKATVRCGLSCALPGSAPRKSGCGG